MKIKLQICPVCKFLLIEFYLKFLSIFFSLGHSMIYNFPAWHIRDNNKTCALNISIRKLGANNETETMGCVRLEIRQSGESIYGTLIFNYRPDATQNLRVPSSVHPSDRSWDVIVFGTCNGADNRPRATCSLRENCCTMRELHSSGICQGFSLVQLACSYAINPRVFASRNTRRFKLK